MCDSCAFRAEPVHKGDKVVPPASFSAEPLPEPKMIPDELPTVSDDVLGEVLYKDSAFRKLVDFFSLAPCATCVSSFA